MTIVDRTGREGRMEIGCEKCGTRFELEDSLIQKEGSKVRCSVCRHVFTAYPPEETIGIDAAPAEDGTPLSEGGIDPSTDISGEADATKEIFPDEGFAEARGPSTETETQEEIDFDRLLEEARRGIDEESPVPAERTEEPAAEMEYESEIDQTVDEGDHAGFSDAVEQSEEETEPERPRKRSRVSIVLLVVVLMLAGAAAGYYYFKPAEKKELPDAGVRRLSFEAVTSSFVDSKEAGLLFIIQGKVKNNYPRHRSHMRVKASVLDDKSRIVKRQTAYAGNTYKEEEIKVLPLAAITKAMENRDGMDGRNLNVAPGASVSFMIVFDHFPENLSEFTVEAVSSSPAAP